MKFTYQQYISPASPTAPSGIVYRPVVPLRIIGTAAAVFSWATVDTGSDDTLLPLSVGYLVGAKLDASQTWNLEGIAGQTLSAVLGEVTLEVRGGNQIFRWLQKVGFVDFSNPQDEVFLLGHAGCLDYFRITCDGHRRELEIDVTPALLGQVI